MSNKNKIAENISKKTSLPKSISKDLIDVFLKLITEEAQNKKVKIAGFGSYNIHTTSKRIGRNPKTGDSYIIKPMKKMNFKASQKVKDFIN